MRRDPAQLSVAKAPPIALFALTVFTSAYLLFQVQPLIGKLILPWFGGSPSVWTAAMLFFQCMLFGGYLYAHLIASHIAPRAQVLTHIVLLMVAVAAAAFVLPGPALKPTGDESPTARILLLLIASVGLPYFCLATTGPLIQYWFARACPGRSPFRLYALSNAGSFLALLSFPYVFEPLFEVPTMGRMWTIGFWVFALLCAAVTLHAGHAAASPRAEPVPPKPSSPATPPHPSATQRVAWVLLPALPSLAFIATTDHVSHDIAPEPRLWITTLALYLLTFIICFDHPRWYRRMPVAAATLVGIVLLCGRDEIPAWFGQDWDWGVTEVRWSHLAVMFLICLMCHGELYRRRPTHPRHLTEFYLWLAFGGACGGLFVALVATNLFADYYEWSLCLMAATGLACFILASAWMPGRPRMAKRAALGASLALCGLVLFWEDPADWRSEPSGDYTDIRLEQSRNFYGTVSVHEKRHAHDPSANYRVFYSGRIIHGMQYVDPSLRSVPLTYFSRDSGVGETLDYLMSIRQSIRVAVVGLGAGTLATYARAPDHYDFYEINPEVVRIANQWFDNLPRCLARTRQVIVGDARLKLEQLPQEVKYDLIALDAFTGSSVPIHLLTREAFELYRRHLKPGGFIVVNITNSYLNLYPVVRRAAQHIGMPFRNKYQPPNGDAHSRRSHYFVMTEDREYLRRFPSVNRRHYDDTGAFVREEEPDLPDIRLWTDQFSSLSPIVRRD